ncbi:hypothetical protein [Fervidobacterium thailandense]|uniref:DUF4340 domain-containing protein n=1 Tax=Fervidobacterium thailandense TaxID=1008305 RepID=A0A1E3G3Z1_9BACT|nr:hypothetical protein [Fervidobacterium thailandense]ODN30995.1 hypothetical protein A4H02_01600 [Fervidobacterium thailandense]
MRRYRYVRKNRRYIITSALLVAIALMLLFGILFANRSVDVFENYYGDFKLLTIKEVFQYGLKTYTVQFPIFGRPRLIGFDSFRNRYTLYFENGRLTVEVGNRKIEDPEKQYERLYTLALINIVEKNAPVEVVPAEQKLLFEYVPNGKFTLLRNGGKDFVVYSGNRQDGKFVEIWFTVERARDSSFKVKVEKASLDGKILSDKELSALLSEIYKKSFNEDLVTLIKSAYLNEIKDYTLGEFAQKFADARWYVKDEAGKLVELVIADSIRLEGSKEPTTVTITLGLKLETIGQASLQYVVVNNEEIQKEKLQNFVVYLFAKQFRDFHEKESLRIVELIRNGVIQSHNVKINDLFNTIFKDQSWEVEFTPDGANVTFRGTLLGSESPTRILFVYNGKTALIQQVVSNNNVVSSKTFLNEALNRYEKLRTQSEVKASEEELVERVKQTKLVRTSPHKDNQAAFESFLNKIVWTGKLEDKTVTVSGIGTYAGKALNFEFIFDVSTVTPVLKTVRVNDQTVDETVIDYIIGKIFLVPNYEYGMLEYVKNYVVATKTLREVFGENVWTVDVKRDLVVLKTGKLSGAFRVELDGSVRCVQLAYDGRNVIDQLGELVRALESGKTIAEFFESTTIGTTPQVPQVQQTPKVPQLPKNSTDTQVGGTDKSKPETDQKNGKAPESTNIEYGQF